MGASLIRKSIKGTLRLACLHFDLVMVLGMYDKENQQDRHAGRTRASTAARHLRYNLTHHRQGAAHARTRNGGSATQPESNSTLTDRKRADT